MQLKAPLAKLWLVLGAYNSSERWESNGKGMLCSFVVAHGPGLLCLYWCMCTHILVKLCKAILYHWICAEIGLQGFFCLKVGEIKEVHYSTA